VTLAVDPSRVPASTYRLQFHAGFTFRDATAIVPYLHELGITHVYASPYLKAKPGSMHGYDVIDHCALNPELGTCADFDAWCDALAKHGMSHILDIVPNHVGVGTNENVWWNDVLEHGRESRYASYFDIAWQGSPRPAIHGKVLLPLLGDHYANVLERGELKLIHDGGKFWVSYYERRFPIFRDTLERGEGEAIEAVLARCNGTAGDPRSWDALDRLLDRQHYRLAYWRLAADEINYRRFFDVNDLAALAMEGQEVFDATHKLIFQLIDEGRITGLRVDHPDGLYDPQQYFERLQQRGANYVVAEKILAVDEPLPNEWPVHGTSGYDFLNMVNGLFVDSRNEAAMTNVYAEFIERQVDFADLAYEKKKLILQTSLASELHMLARRLDELAQRYRNWRDFTLNRMVEALREVTACFGVYRTYINSSEVRQRDVGEIDRGIERAIARNPKTEQTIFTFIRDVLLQRYPDTFTEQDRADQLAFAGKFQQLTSPATAKGIEDTAFYIYNRLASLNEVGGEPGHFGISPERLHDYFVQRQRDWPAAMSTLSTHDTKRSEDVRARINLLSEIPDLWREHVTRWRRINAPLRTSRDAPTPNDEYLLYQILIGAWPIEQNFDRAAFIQRIQQYMRKAMREAKISTSWTDPDEAYESAVADFAAAIIDDASAPDFVADFLPLQRRVSHLGMLNSLAQTTLKLTAPGMPDTYQGTESWELSLVDPDNRRPVDYTNLASALRHAGRPAEMPIIAHKDDLATSKLSLHRYLLHLRRDHRELFTLGDYTPIEAAGPRAKNVFAFLRRHEKVTALVVVPRLLASVVRDGEIPLGRSAWHNTHLLLPANRLPVEDLLSTSPIAARVTRE
jgi:(1->4)-alpha-D-glucan 1-alpha-D-glucosylmutase